MRFSEVKQVQRLVESLIPDEKFRQICLSVFADSIARLHAHGTDVWGAYCASKCVRLLGGSHIVLTIENQCLWLCLDSVSLTSSQKVFQDVDTNESWRWDAADYPQYRKVQSKNGYYVPSPNNRQDWQMLKPLYFAFLDNVAQKYEWLNIKSQKKHNPTLIAYLRDVLSRDIPEPRYGPHSRKKENPSTIYIPEEVSGATKLYEGSKIQITVNAYERNPIARQMCINHFGTKCFVCGFDFAEKYGEIAKGIIHVHHLTRLADISEAYEVDPIEDLRPVCPNCHAVIHKRDPPYSIDELRGFISNMWRDS